MYLKKEIFLIALIILTASSCRRVSQLSQEDRLFIPYSGNEKLIFVSNHGGKDTISLSGFENYFSTEKPKGLSRNVNIEHYNLMYIFDSGYKPLEEDASKTYFIGLTARETKEIIVSFNLQNPNRQYFFWNSLNIDTFRNNKNPEDTITIENKHKNETEGNTSSQSNIKKMFWINTKGAVGFTLSNGEVWKLQEVQNDK